MALELPATHTHTREHPYTHAHTQLLCKLPVQVAVGKGPVLKAAFNHGSCLPSPFP